MDLINFLNNSFNKSLNSSFSSGYELTGIPRSWALSRSHPIKLQSSWIGLT